MNAEAIVLRTWPIREADQIVALFTREFGKVKGVAKSAAKSRRRFGGALEPMTHVRASFVEKPRQELVRLGPGTNKTLQALARVARACPIPVRWALAHGPRWMHSTPGPLAFESGEPGESPLGSLAPIASRESRGVPLEGISQFAL